MNGSTVSRALQLVSPHCDIEDRLPAVPPSAAIRGLFIHNVEKHLRRVGQFEAYREYFPSDDYHALPLYPLSDYMVRLAVAGALVASPAELHAGMREITRSYARRVAESLLGKTLIRLLANEPGRLTEQGLAARRQTHHYGRWTLLRHGPRELEVIYEDEYCWILSAVAGAAEGTYEGLPMRVEHEHRLCSRFVGSTIHRW